MAVVSERVTADVIEANEFPDLSQQFQVSGVPKIVINDTVELLGAQREQRFLQAVVNAATA
jgi:predicted DsbA family dithiol-disulfide isomerase